MGLHMLASCSLHKLYRLGSRENLEDDEAHHLHSRKQGKNLTKSDSLRSGLAHDNDDTSGAEVQRVSSRHVTKDIYRPVRRGSQHPNSIRGSRKLNTRERNRLDIDMQQANYDTEDSADGSHGPKPPPEEAPEDLKRAHEIAC